MKEVAPHDRPREKLERLGAQGLGDNELLAIVIGSGSRNADALDLANRLLERAGGVHGLTRLGMDRLRVVSGVGPARAARIIAAVELGRRTLVRAIAERPQLSTPRELAAYLLAQYGTTDVEQFGIVMLDTKNRIIRVRIVSSGSLDSTVVHPREVFREAASAAAAAIVLFHNHPSGDPTPSPDDLHLTAETVAAGRLLDVPVLDHLIVGHDAYVSLRDRGVAFDAPGGRRAADGAYSSIRRPMPRRSASRSASPAAAASSAATPTDL
jgi:DNA repair protein RadC